MKFESSLLPAGSYYVGDPCYFVQDDRWAEWLNSANYKKDPDILEGSLDDFVIAAARTKYGDGSYPGSDGIRYAVDSGSVGAVPEEIAREKRFTAVDQLGSLVNFKKPFTVSVDDEGTIQIGHIFIETGETEDNYDTEQYWDDWNDG